MKSKLCGMSTLIACAVLTTLDASGARAAGRSASFEVGLTVHDTCTVTAVTPDAGTAPRDVTVNCSGRTSPYVLQDGDFEPKFGKVVRALGGESNTPGARYALDRDSAQAAVIRAVHRRAAQATNVDESAPDAADDVPNVVTTTVVF
ncbi:hypothetical protein [Caballeronia cordobensis]|uniref:hypothetical protein n=1 Tax=Caballeronia cordobensis TaxID=1353886 RepID=UPI0002E5E989|nr:uncharacterized protein BRPE67_DCDS00810 [Burkholderia sp. RPE67]